MHLAHRYTNAVPKKVLALMQSRIHTAFSELVLIRGSSSIA